MTLFVIAYLIIAVIATVGFKWERPTSFALSAIAGFFWWVCVIVYIVMMCKRAMTLRD